MQDNLDIEFLKFQIKRRFLSWIMRQPSISGRRPTKEIRECATRWQVSPRVPDKRRWITQVVERCHPGCSRMLAKRTDRKRHPNPNVQRPSLIWARTRGSRAGYRVLFQVTSSCQWHGWIALPMQGRVPLWQPQRYREASPRQDPPQIVRHFFRPLNPCLRRRVNCRHRSESRNRCGKGQKAGAI